jgi:hypothetical protein
MAARDGAFPAPLSAMAARPRLKKPDVRVPHVSDGSEETTGLEDMCGE